MYDPINVDIPPKETTCSGDKGGFRWEIQCSAQKRVSNSGALPLRISCKVVHQNVPPNIPEGEYWWWKWWCSLPVWLISIQ